MIGCICVVRWPSILISIACAYPPLLVVEEIAMVRILHIVPPVYPPLHAASHQLFVLSYHPLLIDIVEIYDQVLSSLCRRGFNYSYLFYMLCLYMLRLRTILTRL